MIITIPIPQKISTNKFYAGIHWAQRKKIADIYHNALIEHRNKRVMNFPVEVTTIFSFKKRLLDVDNCSVMAKLLIDGLRVWDIIPDDTPKYISALHIYVQKGNEDSVEINIL